MAGRRLKEDTTRLWSEKKWRKMGGCIHVKAAIRSEGKTRVKTVGMMTILKVASGKGQRRGTRENWRTHIGEEEDRRKDGRLIQPVRYPIIARGGMSNRGGTAVKCGFITRKHPTLKEFSSLPLSSSSSTSSTVPSSSSLLFSSSLIFISSSSFLLFFPYPCSSFFLLLIFLSLLLFPAFPLLFLLDSLSSIFFLRLFIFLLNRCLFVLSLYSVSDE